MKHLLVWLLLSSLCSLSSWGIRDMLVVIQSPHNVTVTEGDSVQIQCCWNQNVSRGTVNWHKEGHIEIKYKSVLVTYSQCYDRASQQTVACNCSNWTISNVTRNYTGTYICKVSLEIPSLIESVGDGTRITVTSQNTTNNDSSEEKLPQLLPIMIPLAVLPLFLLPLICLYRAWKRHQGGAKDRTVRVIHEAPNHEDEELKMEELEEAANQSSSSSSRGSTQWCQVQVYESLDYLALPTQDKG
ncbi:transmembrane and immunoglobulin domain-containing protein 2 [Oncorhynchus mykiss]|uniref:transmembrane and immunoglobulin domain-containing protein 2 n=1 Tax=Oncorhynchus mykiss TaxID=8022 RepID=UPI001878B3A0|nr:transmembrane and immunoglobulin domain-containing protein 2 [Oncorhynchus mykiss]